MIKRWDCPEATVENTIPVFQLFIKCFNPVTNSIDASTALSEWKMQNYTRVSERDFILAKKVMWSDAFQMFVELLVECFGDEHITEPLKYKTGFIGQSKMLYTRKAPRRPKARNTAWAKKDNQLMYVGIR